MKCLPYAGPGEVGRVLGTQDSPSSTACQRSDLFSQLLLYRSYNGAGLPGLTD